MRWCSLILALGLLAQTIADPGPDPEPKKFKPESKEKSIKITEEEKAFLKEVEVKYGVKTSKPKVEEEKSSEKGEDNSAETPKPFPAVIAIEIVNDTNTEVKGKRTIDANLGYGYRTNNGYSYTYFGKPKQEQGKFMIYPYSQEDIPAARPIHQQNFGNYQRPQYHNHNSKLSQSISNAQNVEIQPSKAYELVPVTDSPSSYNSYEPVSELKTQYERVKTMENPPPPPYSVSESPEQDHSRVPSTLFTTYNGGQLSGLTGQFPSVMSNYFVESSQLLQNPQFQNVGLTSDYLRQHGPKKDQRVVPVLVLRIPSSHLRNPSADLYPNLPSNYPLSNYLNNVNLQGLVTQYFKKIGYPHIPQVMTHYTPLSNSHVAAPYAVPEPQYIHTVPGATPEQQYTGPVSAPRLQYGPAASSIPQYSAPAAPETQYEPQHYASPEPRPTYTHVDYSGVQYSAVQPVMAKYPVVPSQLYSGQHFMIQHPHTQQVYENPQALQGDFRKYLNTEYQQPHYQQPQYEFQYVEQSGQPGSEEYQQPGQATSAEYESPKEESPAKGHAIYGPPNNAYGPPSVEQEQRQSDAGQEQHYQEAGITDTQSYTSPEPETQTEGKSVPISENYPSKDHTQVTIIPHNYQPRKQHSPVQAISYVTPSPHHAKYHPYKMLAPQSVLSADQGVSYINSHSIPSQTYRAGSYSQEVSHNPEQEQTADITYVPPVGSQKPPHYPRNYHSHGGHHKRMTSRQENKSKSQIAKNVESNEKRPSS